MVALAYPEHLGNQTPRIEVIPEGIEHQKWPEIVEFVAATGTVLDPWQLRVLWVSLLRNGPRWAAFAVACCCPRQNGKNGILEIRELIGPLVLGEKLVIHTAHLADTSKEGFRRLDDLIDANEWLSKQVKHIWRTNGHESIEFKGGRRIRFRTRTRGGGRGFSGSPVIFDESMFLSEISMGSILPVISAQPDPQIWYMGSAVDQQIHDEGVVFARVRERALSEEHDRLAYFEWSLDADMPDQLEDEVARDPQAWAQANPALGIRIMPEYIEAERKELDPRTFAVERLGVGDWPHTDGVQGIIPLEHWETLMDELSRPKEPVIFTFDVSLDRKHAAIVVVGEREDGLVHLELSDYRTGTGWLVGRLRELQERHHPSVIACDGFGPASSLVRDLELVGVPVRVLDTREYTKACGFFYDTAMQSRLRHLGSPEWRAALKGVAQRPVGDAWVWSRRNSTIDITTLVAGTVGVWAVTNLNSEPFGVGW